MKVTIIVATALFGLVRSGEERAPTENEMRAMDYGNRVSYRLPNERTHVSRLRLYNRSSGWEL